MELVMLKKMFKINKVVNVLEMFKLTKLLRIQYMVLLKILQIFNQKESFQLKDMLKWKERRKKEVKQDYER